MGVGSIGLLCVMVAKAAGAGRLIAIDASEHACKHALAMGATHAINPRREVPLKRVYEIIPAGPDLIVEAAGPIVAVMLMEELRSLGARRNGFRVTTTGPFEIASGHTNIFDRRIGGSLPLIPLSMTDRHM